MKPYLVIDIETTGLSHDSQVLQLAAVLDDGGPKDGLLRFDTLIDNTPNPIKDYSAYALGLNGWIFKEIAAGEKSAYKVTPVQVAKTAWADFLSECSSRINESRLYVGGKNVGSFDIPILKANGFSTDQFRHRIVDPGAMYFRHFGYVPSLDEINKKLGRVAVTHHAMDDCDDVVFAVRSEIGLKYE
jgi:hypothetical protein